MSLFSAPAPADSGAGQPDEAELVRRARRADGAAWEAIARGHSRHIRRRRILKSPRQLLQGMLPIHFRPRFHLALPQRVAQVGVFRLDETAQLGQCPAEARLGRAGRDAQRRRGLPLGEAQKVTQVNDILPVGA